LKHGDVPDLATRLKDLAVWSIGCTPQQIRVVSFEFENVKV